MIRLAKKIIIAGAIMLIGLYLMLQVIQEQLGQLLLLVNNKVHSIPGINISYNIQVPELFTDYLDKVKYSSDLQVFVFVLSVILIIEVLLKISAMRNSYN
ncbi:MAG: hypothetical protein Q8936_17135 [Bacillota bacterium]|nr:hypothetical protein [Bacillota bacterium]